MQLLQILTLCLTAMTIQTCSLPKPNCPDLEVVKNFDVGMYAGRWYEISRVHTAFQLFGECVTASYTVSGDPNALYPVAVLNRQYNESSTVYESRHGGARLADSASGEGKLVVFFPPELSGSSYWVLDTDYTRYAVVFSCNDYNGEFTHSVWILSREPTLSDEANVFVDASVARNMLDKSTFVLTRQGGSCVYDDGI